jgi:hypothetical protein
VARRSRGRGALARVVPRREKAMLRRLLVFGMLALGSAPAWAQLFGDGFDEVVLAPRFALVEGRPTLPPGPLSTQLDWFLDELANGQSTTQAEVIERFAPAYVSQFSAPGTVSFINTIRISYPDAYVSDVITATPARFVAVIRTPANSNIGFFQFGTRLAEGGQINQLGVQGFASGTVQVPADQGLTFAQAADKFMTLSSQSSLLAARIDADGQCQTIQGRNEETLRATASIFKIWVLAGVARATSRGLIGPQQGVALVADDIAPAGVINAEPLGTVLSVLDLARLMLGISDNTATDHLHTLVGRSLVDEEVAASGVAMPAVLQPLLNINEQFHVFRTLDLSDATAYVTGSESYQYDYLPTLEALGPLTSTPNFWVDLLVDGTWRASPRDICQSFAYLRSFRGAGLALIDEALGASAAQPNVRNQWDRVWYKGGSLAQATNQYNVWTHAWLLERNGEDPLVLVAMANSPTGGISGINNVGVDNDIFDIQSVNGRMLQLLSEL